MIEAPILAALVPGTCHEQEHLDAWMREQGMALESWGLDDDGHMLRLWLREDGRFAVVVTTPERCSWAILPFQHFGTLSPRAFSETPDGKPADRRECAMHPIIGEVCGRVREPLGPGWPM
jgi:hypothetical protein